MPDPDRIVILNDFSSVTGGAGYLATTLAGALALRGLPVTYISGDAGDAGWPDRVEPVALGAVRLLDEGIGSAAIQGLYNRAASVRVRRWIARNDTPRTIYHMHNWSNILSPAVFDALAPVAGRCVIHAHDFFLACPNGAFLDYPRASVCTRTPLSAGCLTTNCDKRAFSHKIWRSARQRMLFSRLAPHLAAATFVMIHDAMRPWLSRAIQPRTLIAIGNPVTPFGPVAPAPETRRKLVHIGQIQRLKGVYDLAHAGRQLNAEVSFFGEGEDLNDLRQRYPEHTYHGWTSRDQIAQHLQSARAVVVATQSPEPFCLAAFESAATGLPLIVSDAILASGDLVQSGAAIPFRAGDRAHLTETLRRALNDDHLIQQLARSARENGPRLGHTLAEWVSAHADLYTSIANEDHRAAS